MPSTDEGCCANRGHYFNDGADPVPYALAVECENAWSLSAAMGWLCPALLLLPLHRRGRLPSPFLALQATQAVPPRQTLPVKLRSMHNRARACGWVP